MKASRILYCTLLRAQMVRDVESKDKLLGLLPRELGAPEVAKGGSARVDRPQQVELLDDRRRAKVEILFHNGQQVVVRAPVARRAVRVHVQRERLVHADRVRDLHECAAAEARGHQRLGNPTPRVCAAAVSLIRVLPTWQTNFIFHEWHPQMNTLYSKCSRLCRGLVCYAISEVQIRVICVDKCIPFQRRSLRRARPNRHTCRR